MKQYFASLIIFVISQLPIYAQISFEGNRESVVTITPSSSSGLEAIYVLRETSGVNVSLSGETSVKWSRFGTNGAAYAEPISTSQSISLDSQDCGYVAEVNGNVHYFWIVNYANHIFNVNSLLPDLSQSDCQRTFLSFNGSAEPITYYTINGRSQELDRDIKVQYSSLSFDAEAEYFKPLEIEESFSSIKTYVTVQAPLCDTEFTISGDRFLKSWNEQVEFKTPTLQAYALSAETTATQSERIVDNEQQIDGASLGGSAPCEITFSAATTDAVSFFEWQLATNSQFDPIDDRYPQTELTYTFRDYGTTYVRFFAANSEGQCEYLSPTYEVSIGESALLCPNAFSPQSSPGVNDEWKVSYKSLISFDCHIFNRWGTEVCSFSDPSQGWDGRYNGKYVPAGTYYYVIKARGADGRDYKLSGDINIIGAKNINSSSDTPVE